MSRYLSKRTATSAVIVLGLLAAMAVSLNRARSRARNPARSSRERTIPPTVLWAWERPTDLKFIDPELVGVAFLARTVRLRADETIVHPRLQSLALPERATVIAVVRVETDRSVRPTLSADQAERLVKTIAEVSTLRNVAAVQIDFDATRSEREFYRSVIFEVRRRLPERIGLSITALASWCADDAWLSGLPIDEAVPMLFRMGADRQQVRNRLTANEEFNPLPCRGSYGISTDEPLENLRPEKRLYVFNPDAWTEQSVRAVLESRK